MLRLHGGGVAKATSSRRDGLNAAQFVIPDRKFYRGRGARPSPIPAVAAAGAARPAAGEVETGEPAASTVHGNLRHYCQAESWNQEIEIQSYYQPFRSEVFKLTRSRCVVVAWTRSPSIE